MACSDITAGIGLQCKNSVGGLQNIYIFNNLGTDVDPFTITGSEATAMNILLTTSYKFEIVNDGHVLEQNFATDRNTFTTINTQTITAILGVMSATKHATLELLSKGYPMAVVEDGNGLFHAVGLYQNRGIDFNVVATTGSNMNELNAYTLTGTSMSNAYAPILDSATVTAFLATVQANP